MEDANLARGSEKENINANNDFSSQETLRANPILANLLKSGVPPTNLLSNLPEMTMTSVFDSNNVLSIENQIMTALAANMESYIRNLSNFLSAQPKNGDDIEARSSDEEQHDSDQEQHNSDGEETISDQEQHNFDKEQPNSDQELLNSDQEEHNSDHEQHNSDQEQYKSDEHTHHMFANDQNSDKSDENSDYEDDYLVEHVSNGKHKDLLNSNNDFVSNGHSPDRSVEHFVKECEVDQLIHNIDIDNQKKLNDSGNNYQNYNQEDQNSANNSQNYENVQNCIRDYHNYENDNQNFNVGENNSYKDVQNFDNDC